MDPIEVELLKAARDLRTMAQARLQNTIAEIADLEEQLHQLRSQRDGQLDADRRLRDYHPKVGTAAYVCPNCWILSGEHVPLAFIRFGSEDLMRCPKCCRDFGISLRAPLTAISRRSP